MTNEDDDDDVLYTDQGKI